jgi:diadenosine tetraphosphate (Ap4A) HIT family hydrolase
MKIIENDLFFVEVEPAEIPWLKIFPQKPYKELSQCDEQTRNALFDAMMKIEKEMLAYYQPEKVNIAMFGNYLPHLHIHIMARFKEDSYFPESMWGKKQREANLCLPDFEIFLEKIKEIFKSDFC